MTQARSAVKEIIEVPGLPKPRGVWSTVVQARPGRMVFVSGLLAKDESGDVVCEGDMAGQMEQILVNMGAALASAGGSLADIVRVDVYTTDISKFKEIHEVRRRHFPQDPPASTMVQVTGLTDPRCLIEMNAIAVLPQDD